MNFKKGFRRIAIIFILIFSISIFAEFMNCKEQLENSYIWNIDVVNIKTKQKIGYVNFLDEYTNKKIYLEKDEKYFVCHPYMGYCDLDSDISNIKVAKQLNKTKIKNNTIIEYNKNNQKEEFKIKTKPYEFWGELIFIMMFPFILALILWGAYLLIEFIFCWIIQGFKKD